MLCVHKVTSTNLNQSLYCLEFTLCVVDGMYWEVADVYNSQLQDHQRQRLPSAAAAAIAVLVSDIQPPVSFTTLFWAQTMCAHCVLWVVMGSCAGVYADVSTGLGASCKRDHFSSSSSSDVSSSSSTSNSRVSYSSKAVLAGTLPSGYWQHLLTSCTGWDVCKLSLPPIYCTDC